MTPTPKQQLVYKWLQRLRLPVYAEAYIGAVRLLQEKSAGYGTFVSHTGRDIMNSLARVVIGIPGGRVQYEQELSKLETKWRDEQHHQCATVLRGSGDGHVISADVYGMITDLIEDHKEGRRRNQENGKLFISTFLGSSDQDRETVVKKWKQLQRSFLECAHLREDDLSEVRLSEIKSNFETLEMEFLYVAAVREHSRLRTLDTILEATNKSKKEKFDKKLKKLLKRAVERSLELFKHESDRIYFYTRLENPRWISPLSVHGCFLSPPAARALSEESIQYPIWPELLYLKNLSEQENVPKQVLDEIIAIVSNLPRTDNLRVYNDLMDIAQSLAGDNSVRLKGKIFEYVELQRHLIPGKFAELLAHWTSENQTEAALELAERIVQFHPDYQADGKHKREEGQGADEFIGYFDSTLNPAPAVPEWDYQQIMEQGVRPLASKEPLRVANMLVDAATKMIQLRMRPSELQSGTGRDTSEIWCPRLDEQSRKSAEPNEILINTLVFACEEVFSRLPVDSITSLDDSLRTQRWHVFLRLRQHLYGHFPSDQTKPWVRELVLEYAEYAALRDYSFEFQRMVRRSCEHFGSALLSEDERTRIFEAILGGATLEAYKKRMGDQSIESDFQQWRHQTLCRKLNPFSSVLFGKYAKEFMRTNKDERQETISDDSYLPFQPSEAQIVTFRSPRSPEALAQLSDEELLAYINEWQDEHYDREARFTEVTISALADAFHEVFLNSIIPDADRLDFWVRQNRDRIERPVYVEHMVKVFHEHVESGKIDKLEQWFEFCQWVVSHPDGDRDADSLESPTASSRHTWQSARSAVVRFVELCLKKETKLPFTFRKTLGGLLRALCTQPDWHLDNHITVHLFRDEPFTDAINSTRGCALRSMVEFGRWIRRHDEETEITEIRSILEQRFGSDAGNPLTIPEYALLGQYFTHIFHLDNAWTAEHKSDFFPQDCLPAWQVGFGQFLCGNEAYNPVFEYVRDDYKFALSQIGVLKQYKVSGREALDALGQHLFVYYVTGLAPMMGAGSLLEVFYRQTDGGRDRWATLFDWVGRNLRNAGERLLETTLKEKIYAFFEWRLVIGEPRELREFSFWLRAKCLETEWRLNAYARILEVPEVLDAKFGEPHHASLHAMALRKLIPIHTAQVVACFAKLIQAMPEDSLIYIPLDHGKAILNAGRNHPDENVRKMVDDAREVLLRGRQLEYLELVD